MLRMIIGSCAALAAAIPSASVEIRPQEMNLVDAIRNTPLPAARQNLLLARSRIVKHCYAEAIVPLLITADALAFVEEQEIGRYHGFGAAVGYVRQEILDYTIRIETNNTNALPNIDAWLYQMSEWNAPRNRPDIPSRIPGARGITVDRFYRSQSNGSHVSLHVCRKGSLPPQNLSISGRASAEKPVERNMRRPSSPVSYSGCRSR